MTMTSTTSRTFSRTISEPRPGCGKRARQPSEVLRQSEDPETLALLLLFVLLLRTDQAARAVSPTTPAGGRPVSAIAEGEARVGRGNAAGDTDA